MVRVKGPQLGLPAGIKEAGQRVDFKDKQFDLLIESKGPRLAWARAAMCPCKSAETQYQQPDPNCDLCENKGFIWFRPKDYTPPIEAGIFTDHQLGLINRFNAVVIRGYVQSVKRNEEAFDQLGQWVYGSFDVSVRKGNRLGYYDRLILLDGELPYSQIIFSGADPTQPIKARYPIIPQEEEGPTEDEEGECSVALLRSKETVYEVGADFEVNTAGDIQFFPGKEPPADTKMTIHYLHLPHMLVWDHPHQMRQTLVSGKFIKDQVKISPLGNPQRLPVQATAKLEFLLDRDKS